MSDAEPPVTVSIDSDGAGVAVQINGIDSQGVAPMFTPDEADRLAEDLRRAANAARDAERDDKTSALKAIIRAFYPVYLAAVAMGPDWNDTSGSFSRVDALNEHCAAIDRSANTARIALTPELIHAVLRVVGKP